MIAGIVAKVPAPRDSPGRADNSEYHERASPSDEGHQPSNQWWRDGIAKPCAGMGDALSERTLAGGSPVAHRSRGGGKGGTFAETEHDASEYHCCERGDQAREKRGRGPNDC